LGISQRNIPQFSAVGRPFSIALNVWFSMLRPKPTAIATVLSRGGGENGTLAHSPKANF